jgi:hypothetical protein
MPQTSDTEPSFPKKLACVVKRNCAASAQIFGFKRGCDPFDVFHDAPPQRATSIRSLQLGHTRASFSVRERPLDVRLTELLECVTAASR